jgi:hypothetical protein
LAIVSCGGPSTNAASPRGVIGGKSATEYRHCKDEQAAGDATACWTLFVKRYGDIASDSERDYAQAYIDQRRGASGQQDQQAMAAAARTEQPTESISATPTNVAPASSGSGDAPATAVTFPVQQVGFSDCYRSFSTSNDASSDLQHLTDLCGAPTGMIRASTVHSASQDEADPQPDVFDLQLDVGSCYRIFAVGDPGITSMNAMVTTAADTQTPVAKDISGDRLPIVGPHGPFCPAASGTFKYIVSVMKGKGTYYFQLWVGQHGEDPGSAPTPVTQVTSAASP